MRHLPHEIDKLPGAKDLNVAAGEWKLLVWKGNALGPGHARGLESKGMRCLAGLNGQRLRQEYDRVKPQLAQHQSPSPQGTAIQAQHVKKYKENLVMRGDTL